MRPRWESSPVEAGAPPVENGSSNRKSWVPPVGDGVPPVGDGAPQEKMEGLSTQTQDRQGGGSQGRGTEKTCLRTERVRISSQQRKKAEKQNRVLKNSVLPHPPPIFSSGEPWGLCQFVLQASRSFRKFL